MPKFLYFLLDKLRSTDKLTTDFQHFTKRDKFLAAQKSV